MTKIVSQLDEQGYFLHAEVADESPLEPGIYIIPRNCVDFPPPTNIPEDYRAKFNNGSWVFEKFPGFVVEEMAEVVSQYLEYVAKEHGYDSILTAISYADEPVVEKFQKEGKQFRRWRSLVWKFFIDISKERMTPNELIKRLPKFDEQ